MKKFSKLFLGLALFINSSALAAEFGVLGGLSAFLPTYTFTSLTTTAKSYSSLEGGIYVKESLGGLFSVDFEALYVKRKSGFTIPTLVDRTYESKAFQIPIILRANLIPGGYINFGVGGYYEVGMSGGVDATDNLTGQTGNFTYAGLGLKHNDFGAIGSAQFKLPLAPMAKFILDVRYLYGLTEQSNDTSVAANGFSTKNRYLQILAGLGFGL